ncbi:uncharacterized protein F4812DRAFT_420483 [Daldinia caldariorum]|uniref:uncharacterized protein n=1 Tax=Daldinia caldariorum TaxID=326644 RepID=UPI002007FC1B|nr:uncharacterized protein F4812DRAFT_420483 [Daldinia caldariorum]KAI1469823.1 hypothetical protein F4812DRAFT_420483 [Daldinia caldariorum]
MSSQSPIKSALPDIICLDEHKFRIHYDVPQAITDRLYELFNRDDEVKYEDIPDDLKEYEVRDPSEEEMPEGGASGARTS